MNVGGTLRPLGAFPLPFPPRRTVPADSMMLLLMGAANRDERVFSDAERYQIGRDTSETLAFGVGRHFCVGAALARLEASAPPYRDHAAAPPRPALR